MSNITLVSGGLDSTLVSLLTKEIGVEQYPLFVDYGQRARHREWAACVLSMQRMGLPQPVRMDLGGFGQLIRSGLTDPSLRVVDDAFTPGRNLLFLLVGASYAMTVGADTVSIGLLNEDTALFPDQTSKFISSAQDCLTRTMGVSIRVVAPLAEFRKKDVVALAQEKGIRDTYSCHTGNDLACGLCISCREFQFRKE